ncbi:MAG: hypothetical protein Q4C49_08450 [Bacillota bacterium]|nr:hypothetical protein [Bacillota bacterium]
MRKNWSKIVCALLLCLSLSACHKNQEEAIEVSNSNSSVKEKASKTEYKELKGRYKDCVSGVATLEIDISEDKMSVDIVVNWENDETELSRWTMNASLQGSRLSYKDSQEYLISFDNSGNEIPSSISRSNGYFTYNADKQTLIWNGSSQSRCQTCIFEKVSSTTTKEEEERRRKEEEALAKQKEQEEQEALEQESEEEYEEPVYEEEYDEEVEEEYIEE